MRITREALIRIAKETAQKRAFSDSDLVAGYLVGSLRSDNPFLGNSTDIDIVFVHAGFPIIHREILPITPEIHLDIVHNVRGEYEKPKELRINPWFGPELYDPLPLYGTLHFFEFVQAGVRAEYNEPVNVLARSRQLGEHARQIWSGLQRNQDTGPELLLSYLKGVNHAANAVALLAGTLLSERRFLLQFQEKARAVGAPGLVPRLFELIGGEQVTTATLRGFLTEWEKGFIDAAGRNGVHTSISVHRLAYYKRSFEALLASEPPQSILWPLIHTWTLAAAVLPPTHRVEWQTACETLGLVGNAFNGHVQKLDNFLDDVEELMEKKASSYGL